MKALISLIFILVSLFPPSAAEYIKTQGSWITLCQYVLEPLDLQQIDDVTLIHLERVKVGCLDRWQENITVPKQFTYAQKDLEEFHHDLWLSMYYLKTGVTKNNQAAIDAARSFLDLAEEDLDNFDLEIKAVYLPQM